MGVHLFEPAIQRERETRREPLLGATSEFGFLSVCFSQIDTVTQTQSIIVHKLNSYARKNKTRQALWEYDNIISSLYLLDFVFGGLCKNPPNTKIAYGYRKLNTNILNIP